MRYYKVTVHGSFLPDAPSTRSLGAVGSEFANIYADDFIGNLTGDVSGDLTGDVLADDASVILSSGADSTASFAQIGTLKSADGVDILSMISGVGATARLLSLYDGATGLIQLLELTTAGGSWFMGDVKSSNGSICLQSGTTPSNAKFGGTATKAKYA